MTKHTPGPWGMNDLDPEVEGPRFTIDSETEKFGQGYWLVATVTRPDDARLIATAPELLKACKNSKKALYELVKKGCGYEGLLKEVEQAIAKAEAQQ